MTMSAMENVETHDMKWNPPFFGLTQWLGGAHRWKCRQCGDVLISDSRTNVIRGRGTERPCPSWMGPP